MNGMKCFIVNKPKNLTLNDLDLKMSLQVKIYFLHQYD